MSDSTAIPQSVSEVVDAVANAPQSISKLLDLAEKLVYGAGYTAAYVVVFPLALVFAVIPKQNALVQGMIEGSAHARARAEQMVR